MIRYHLDDESGESIEEVLERVLKAAENEETLYWIRTALQQLLMDSDGSN